jgi:hypothetical protein
MRWATAPMARLQYRAGGEGAASRECGDDGRPDRRQTGLRRWSVASFFPGSLDRDVGLAGRRRRSWS